MGTLTSFRSNWKKNLISWDLSEIFQPYKERIFMKGELILDYHKPENDIMFIVKGKVLQYCLNERLEKDIAFGLFMNGEILNPDLIVNEQKPKKKAVAKSDTLVRIIPRLAFLKLMEDHPALRQLILKSLNSSQQTFFEKMQRLEWMNTRQRILLYLLDYAEKGGRDVGYERVIRNFLTHQELGHLCNASRQSVTTVLNDLRHKKIIHFNRRYLLIRDMKALENYANMSI